MPARQRASVSVPGDVEETMFVLEGEGRLHVRGETHALGPEMGVYLPPGSESELENTGEGPLRLVAVRVPDPSPGPPMPASTSRLDEQEVEQATTEREFRIVADPATGLRSATHFVGYIPTERAPDHFHTYDEVIYVLDGDGLMQAGAFSRPADGGLVHPTARQDGALPVQLGHRADAHRRCVPARGFSGSRLLSGRNPRLSEQSGPTPEEELTGYEGTCDIGRRRAYGAGRGRLRKFKQQQQQQQRRAAVLPPPPPRARRAAARSARPRSRIEAPFTGPVAQLGQEQLHFAQLAVADDNAANGTNITLVQDDTQLHAVAWRPR